MNDVSVAEHSRGQLRRVAATGRPRVPFTLNGDPMQALEGDTVLTAILTNAPHLRRFEFGGEPRAGFCLMGACQDCWVRQGNGIALRACTTLIEPGMQFLTKSHDGA